MPTKVKRILHYSPYLHHNVPGSPGTWYNEAPFALLTYLCKGKTCDVNTYPSPSDPIRGTIVDRFGGCARIEKEVYM